MKANRKTRRNPNKAPTVAQIERMISEDCAAIPARPGKVMRVYVSFLNNERPHAYVEREDEVSHKYYFSPESAALNLLSDLINSGALRSRVGLGSYVTVEAHRSVDDLALEAMGSD